MPPTLVGLSSLAREVMVAKNKTNMIHKRLNFLCLRWFPRG